MTFNGLTGDVTGVTTGTANNFIALQTFSSGISASGGISFGITFGNDIIVNKNIRIGKGVGGVQGNLAVGVNALGGTGFGNLAIGNQALQSNTTGQYNTAIGYDALKSLTTSTFNVAVGYAALTSLIGGTSNVAIGYGALRSLINTGNNVAIGFDAGRRYGPSVNENVNSSNSLFIGNNTQPLNVPGVPTTYEIVIGNDAIGRGANTTTIGTTAQTLATIYGLLNVPNGISGYNQFRLNGLTGTVGFSAGTGITLTTSGNTLIISATAVSGLTSGVESLRGLTGVIGLVAGTGITFGISGNTLTIISTVTGSCAGTSAGVQTFNGNTGEIVVNLIGGITTTTPSALGITFTTDASWPFYKNYNITNTGVRNVNGITGTVSLSDGTGISITQIGANTLSITNTGVQTLTGSTGISLTGSTGNITITNTGVNNLTASLGITLSGSSGAFTISNTGVRSINSETGAVTNFAKTNNANTFTSNQAITKKTPKLIITDTDGGSSIIQATQISFSSEFLTTQTWISPATTSTIYFPGSTGTLALTSETVSRINGLTGTVGLSAGTGITLTTSGNTLIISATSSVGGGSGDGSAIIYKLYPNLPINGLCAGDIISYNGSCAWIPTPREYLVTPSIWQTRKTSTNGYPTSTLKQPGTGSLTIQGATAVVGELIQLSLDGGDNGGTTLGRGTWWLNYSIYTEFENPGGRGIFNGSFSGLTILNSPSFFTAASLSGDSEHDVAGFAMLIRGSTYNAYDGRGGPFGNTSCTASPNTMPLGDGGVCDGDGVEGYPVTCTPRYGYGFTYGGEFYECVNV
jgi:hypothetical protein